MSIQDPKEYIPFLNQLRRLEDNYCKFTIDRHLGNFTSALVHISKTGMEHFNECLDMVQKNKLYVEALKLYNVSSQEFKVTFVRIKHC